MSPRTEEMNLRIRQEQKKKILDAAAAVFAHKGFSATKMADIAAAADVSYGLLYHYFTNKETIFVASVKSDLEGTSTLMRHALELPDTPWNRLHWLTSQILTGMRRKPASFILILQTLTNDSIPKELQEAIQKYSQITNTTLKQLIVEGQAAGQVAEGNPGRLAGIFSACIGGLAFDNAFPNYLVDFPEPDDVLRLLKP